MLAFARVPAPAPAPAHPHPRPCPHTRIRTPARYSHFGFHHSISTSAACLQACSSPCPRQQSRWHCGLASPARHSRHPQGPSGNRSARRPAHGDMGCVVQRGYCEVRHPQVWQALAKRRANIFVRRYPLRWDIRIKSYTAQWWGRTRFPASVRNASRSETLRKWTDEQLVRSAWMHLEMERASHRVLPRL